MEKVIKIEEYEFVAKSTAASLISYKANFGRDGLKDLVYLSQASSNIENLDIDVFFRFLWIFAKAANPNIKPLEQWLEGFEIPPLDFAFAVLPQITDLLGTTVQTSVKPKN